MPIKADTIMGFRARTKVIVMEILDELGLIKPAKKSTPKPPPDPIKIAVKSAPKKAAVKKAVGILLVFGLASLMFSGSSFALLRPRNMDQVTTDTWTFQNVNIATGITDDIAIAGDVVITSQLKGLDVDVTSAGADANYFGIDNDVAQGAVASGAYLSRGNLLGIASSVTAIGNIDAVYATYSPATMTMATDTEANQLYGGFFMSNVSGPATLTLHDGVMGAQLTTEIAADVTDVTGGLVAAAFIWPNVLKDVTSVTYGEYIKCTSYVDFGSSIQIESNHVTAGQRIQATDSAVLPIGLQFSTDVGTITKEIELANGETIDNNTDGVVNVVGNVIVNGAGINWGGTSTGVTPNAHTVDLTPDIDTLVAGLQVSFISHTTNDGAATLVVDSLASKAIFNSNDASAVAAGDIVQNAIISVIYDGTQWQIVSGNNSN